MYTNQTTHYEIPLPLGTDLTTPMDYNESMQAIDTAVWGATQDAATATSDAANAVEACKTAFKKIDQAVSKGILHKNTAARKKAQLSAKLNKLSS